MKLIVTFYSELEELAVLRTNSAIKNILNVLDWVELPTDQKIRLRKIILDEINGLRNDMIDFFKRSKNGDDTGDSNSF